MITASAEKIREFRARGWWGDETILDLFQRNAGRSPERLALVDPPNRPDLTGDQPLRLTYADVARRVPLVAAAMFARGIRRDDILLVQMPNVVELVEVYLAAAMLGAIISPVPIQFQQKELTEVIGRLQPRAVVSVATLRGRDNVTHVHKALESAGQQGVPLFLCGQQGEAGDRLYRDLGQADTDALTDYLSSIHVTADDVLTICWTSGTEGFPKGIPRSHNQWLAIGLGTYDGCQITDGEVLLNPFPFINMASIGGLFMGWLYSAGTLVLHHPMDLPVFLRQIAEEEVSYTLAPPALLNQLLKEEQLLAMADISSLRAIGSGSAPLDVWMVEGYKERFGIEIINHFGSNEGTPLICGPGDVPETALRARLFPRFGVDGLRWNNRVSSRCLTRLVDPESGREVSRPGENGELQIAGATLFDGYFNAPEQTASAFTEDGFFKTGDLFEIAEESEGRFYRFIGRCKDLIIRGGMNIAPAELDNLISAHQDVVEAAVAGYPCEVMGERIAAFIVLKPGAEISLEGLVTYLRGQGIASFKLPEKVVLIDALPRNPLGKVVRAELQKQLCGEKAA